jgi:hypothetical protein
MKAGCYVQIGVLLMVVLVFGQSGIAALVGSTNFHTGALNGHVNYAVYEPGEYDVSIDLCVYAYQVFNDSNSTVAINYFSVGLSPDVPVYDAMYHSSPGGIAPSMSLALSESVLYVFQGSNIKAGKWSASLLFTSDRPPEMGIGVVPGGVAGSVDVEVPSPVPEPATLALLIGGALLAFRRKRNS